MCKKTIFITRDLSDKSSLYLLEKDGFKIWGESLLEFSGVPFSLNKNYDWLFFYSKNGIRYFFEKVNPKDLSSSLKYATIGTKTAEYLKEKTGINADFIGNGNPDDVILSFEERVSNKKILFARAKNSRLSIQKALKNNEIVDCICYDNQINTTVDIPESDIIVLTSPLNAQAYLAQRTIRNQLLIAIGNTTADYLKSQDYTDVLLPELPEEEAIAKLISSIFKQL